MLSAIISSLAAIVGVLIGVFSTHFLHYVDRKSEERKIINESIHYLIELFFLVNRLNTEKMADIYLNYYFLRVKTLFPTWDEGAIETAKVKYSPMIKDVLIPAIKEQTFEDLKNISVQYEEMIKNLATILPVNAFYLRGKNSLEDLIQSIASYFENVKVADIEGMANVKETIRLVQSVLTENLINEYKEELKSELLALLGKTNWSNCCAGKRAIRGIEASILTENEKRKVDSMVVTIVNLTVQNANKSKA